MADMDSPAPHWADQTLGTLESELNGESRARQAICEFEFRDNGFYVKGEPYGLEAVVALQRYEGVEGFNEHEYFFAGETGCLCHRRGVGAELARPKRPVSEVR